MVPVALHGASSSTASNGTGGCHAVASAAIVSAVSRQCRRLSVSRARRAGSRSSAVTWAPAAASCAVLPPGAAHKSPMRSPGRGASRRAGSAAAASCTQKAPCSNPGSGVTAGTGGKPHGTGRQHLAAVRRQGAGTQRQVQRRLVLVRQRDGARLGAPGGPQPGRGVEPRAVEVGQRRRPRLGDATQHRVHQAGEGVQPAEARQGDRGSDRGVRRRVQQQQPGGAEAQHVAHRLGWRALEERFQHGVQRAEPAQRRGHQAMRRGAVARGERRQRVQRFLQRAAAVEHRGEQVERGVAGGVGHDGHVRR